MKKVLSVFTVLALTVSAQAAGVMRITEYMYNGLGAGSAGEFVEFTNVGDAAVDMTGWSFNDTPKTPVEDAATSLSAFGSVAVGESVILTDLASENVFRSNWSTMPGINSVKVVGANGNNLGRADQINLYDNSNALVDQLTYDDQSIGGVRTNGVSGWTTPANLHINDATKWQLSVVADLQGSVKSSVNEIGSPGTYVVPEPASMLMLSLGFLAAAKRRSVHA